MGLEVSLLTLAAVLQRGWAAASGSVPFEAKTHAPRRSSGCGKASPYTLGASQHLVFRGALTRLSCTCVGQSVQATATYVGVQWTYRIYVPRNYDGNTALPLILQHPGWGMSARNEELGAGITPYADKLGFVSVTPQGDADNAHNGGPWYSWNAVGSTQSPGPGGSTCTRAASSTEYCYESCSNCDNAPQCWWTTCHDVVTPTGTGKANVGGFIPSLYDTLESQLCIDTTREYAAGESNGGMMTYQLGVDLATRLAAIAPQFGSFHRGFNLAPSVGVPVMDTHGISDTTVPANVSLSGDGYYYTPIAEIFGGNAYSTGWKTTNGCTGTPTHYPTSYDDIRGLYCVKEGDCIGGDVVRCAYKGGHTWFDNGGANNGGLISEWLLKWTKPSHIGQGYSEGDTSRAGVLLENISVQSDEDDDLLLSSSFVTSAAQTLVGRRGSPHYGNPITGCLADEDAIYVGSGMTCAPRIGSIPSVGNQSESNAFLEPECRIGGVAPSDNGCPLDADVSPGSKAWPLCLAKGNETDPYDKGDFHCMLVCPCDSPAFDCGPSAHAHCPKGATCERGDLRYMGLGVCTYHPESTPLQTFTL